jgi:hypothetical protein
MHLPRGAISGFPDFLPIAGEVVIRMESRNRDPAHCQVLHAWVDPIEARNALVLVAASWS